MSVGHVARAFEAAGLPTVVVQVRAFRHVAEEMKLPRTIITRHPMGRPLGAPGDRRRQRQVVRAALSLLETATKAPVLIELTAPYRRPISPSQTPQ